MSAPKWRTWLRAAQRDPSSHIRLPEGLTLGALTGQDAKVLDAIAACWLLYAGGDIDAEQGALRAIRALLPALQPHCRPFARELIPWAMDWHDRERLWPLVAGTRQGENAAGCSAAEPQGEPVERS